MSKEKRREEPPIATRKVIQSTKSGKFFLVESAIQGFGFRNLAQESGILPKNGNLESMSH